MKGGRAVPQLGKLIEDAQAPQGRPVCLLLGAGASISSGGMTFAQFKREFFQLLLKDRLSNIVNDTEIEEKVDDFFSRTERSAIRARVVDATFELSPRVHPSEAYMLLVLAMEKRALSAVITTNFDTMLETAEKLLGLAVLRVFANGIASPDDVDRWTPRLHRVPYLKLHGCLGGRTITHITKKELESGQYPKTHQTFIRDHLRNADLVVTGYSGYDAALAKLIGRALRRGKGRVYWCAPMQPDSDAPLVKEIGSGRIDYIECTFDEVAEAIARPLLEKPSFTDAKPIFIPRLLEWRVHRAGREFAVSHVRHDAGRFRNLLVRRRAAEDSILAFLASDRPLAIVTGPSGVGKSALALRLLDTLDQEEQTHVLIVPARAISNGEDFATHLAERIIGGLGTAGAFSFAQFERWLRGADHASADRRRLIVYLDALNEYAVALDKVASLLREVVRFCYFLPHYPAIRVIVTVRQETWSRLLTREDRVRLTAICWNPMGAPNVVHSIQLGVFTNNELEEALSLLCNAVNRPNIFPDLPPQVTERLRDPYLLASVADEVLGQGQLDVLNWVHGPGRQLYTRLYEAKLARNGLGRHADDFFEPLGQAAAFTLKRSEDRFRQTDLSFRRSMAEPSDETFPDLTRCLIDLGILTSEPDGFLRFTHERTLEFFIAKALERGILQIPLRTPEQLDKTLREYDHHHQFMAALRTYFLLDPVNRFTLVANAISKASKLADRDAETRLLAFAKELMVDLAADNPPAYRVWFHRIAKEMTALDNMPTSLMVQSEDAERHWRAMIQAATHLPDHMALEVLTEAARIGGSLPRTEANIYATDKIVRLIRRQGGRIDLLGDDRFRSYYADTSISRLRRLGRVLGLMSQIGPDNTHPDDYAKVRSAAAEAAMASLREGPLQTSELAWFCEFFFRERDRYIFNGDLEGMKRFFRNSRREEFIRILDHLEAGGVLRPGDIEILRPYISETYQDFEFQLGNFLFIISAGNDFDKTIQIWEEHFDNFNDKTPPDTVDFFQAVMVYMYVVNGREYNGIAARHIDRILKECPQIIEYEPGRHRGYGRGFTDEFDMVFEDGFNPIASYATLIPSPHRRTIRMEDYENVPAARLAQVPIYRSHLGEALERGELRKALRILHALGQFIVLWPQEGLWTMVEPIQYDHPHIHRAVIRVLAEAYSRYPLETLRFFVESGIVLSPGDLRDVRSRIDPRIGRRQFEGLQWARVLHFVLSFPGARKRIIEVLRIAYVAPSLEAAVHRIAADFGWLK